MNFIRKIAPFLLLSVFCLTQVHAILPHVHHIHDGIENHHHDEKESNNDHKDLSSTDIIIESKDHHDNLDFLIHLFEGHSHTVAPIHDNDLFLNFQKQKSENDKLSTKLLLYIYHHDIFYITKKYRVFNHLEPERQIDDIPIGSYSYRGPPSLV